MATARDAHMRRIARLMELGRMRLDGKTFAQIATHYGISQSYAYMLYKQFDRLTSSKSVHRLSRYMKDAEAKELEQIKDWLEFLAKEDWK